MSSVLGSKSSSEFSFSLWVMTLDRAGYDRKSSVYSTLGFNDRLVLVRGVHFVASKIGRSAVFG